MFVLYILIFLIFIFFGLVVFLGAPYVPSHKKATQEAFEKLYKLGDKDLLVDFGSGDGAILRWANKLGARAVGYEINPFLVLVSRLMSLGNKNIEIKMTNLWQQLIPDETTVIYAFVVTRDVKKLASKVQAEANRLGRQIYLISYGNQVKQFKQQAKSKGHYLYKITPILD